jgi:hypothetical protein
MVEALSPVVDRVERGIERLARDGWSMPGRSDGVDFELLFVPGEPSAAWVRDDGRSVVRIDVGAFPADRLDRLAPESLHQYAHLLLADHVSRTPAWWIEASARHLASRAEEWAPRPVPVPAEGLAGPASPAELGEPELADAVAAAIGESGFLRIWEEARGGDGLASLRRVFERLAGRSLEEFVLEQALVRETGEVEPAMAIGPEIDPIEMTGKSPSGIAWWVGRFRSTGKGGVEIRLDPRAGDYSVRAVVRYRIAERASDVVEILPGVATRLPLAGVARVSIVALSADLDRNPASPPSLRLRGLPGYPFQLDGSPSVGWSEGAASIVWRTLSHTDLLGWRIARFEARDGKEVEVGETILPTSDEDDAGAFSYRFLDSEATPDRSWSFDVEAVTTGGTLVEGFRLRLGGDPTAANSSTVLP